MKGSYHSIRKQYAAGRLDERDVAASPVKQLEDWLAEAIREEVHEPTAMVVSTVGADLKPSSRVVLMKGLDETGITFFTNYSSRKGIQLAENPNASLLFFWPALERQVRVEGVVEKVSDKESDTYFASRPEVSRISASVSPQSREIPGRDWLLGQRDLFMTRVMEHSAGEASVPSISRPDNWGGYRLIPSCFEFWQGGEDRLHDRIIYKPSATAWLISRLAP
jgi:pyridoxamine 5'-phosphate oxidase